MSIVSYSHMMLVASDGHLFIKPSFQCLVGLSLLNPMVFFRESGKVERSVWAAARTLTERDWQSLIGAPDSRIQSAFNALSST